MEAGSKVPAGFGAVLITNLCFSLRSGKLKRLAKKVCMYGGQKNITKYKMKQFVIHFIKGFDSKFVSIHTSYERK